MTDQDESPLEESEEAEGPAPTDDEWARRVLCSDGNCIGVIGPDGRCKECGKPYEGELPADLDTPEDDSIEEPDPDAEAETSAEQNAEGGEAEDAPADSDDDWDNRVLCSDGNCIGVIGPDGRCKECGKPYAEQ